MTNLYTYTISVSVATENSAGLSWAACAIVLVIFRLISYLSHQTLYQCSVQAVQMMYLDVVIVHLQTQIIIILKYLGNV